MSQQRVHADRFLELAETHLLLDVRSPGEYEQAHIPTAKSLPLFSDAERSAIGTAYKHQSREAAIKMGLDAFGPKMRSMVEQVESLQARAPHFAGGDKTLLVHCWRGGMRSAAVAWLLELYGFPVVLLEGGYKAYRQWVISHWEDRSAYQILDGYTGAGKTEVLHELSSLGQPVLDLEHIAAHKGSAFGGLDGKPRPTQEMFENLLAEEMHRLRRQFGNKPIWIENESQRIGNLNIPIQLFRYWMESDLPAWFLDLPFDERLQKIVREYGSYSTTQLSEAVLRIKKRLGPLETKTTLAFLAEGKIPEAFGILLRYYDKHYGKTKALNRIQAAGLSTATLGQLLLKKSS
ncbi:MAG: tRNA 2-selenouridine(34) synthase MnmH [Bacteroidetes bacterium]|nr:tRNA 2-selenouridine(34) synthase MnmH [Bacteroidota bacterium]MBS1630540.1 tRNA 2-selenouridine(34) synthase MnmH [Bacteroidota bacterium]